MYLLLFFFFQTNIYLDFIEEPGVSVLCGAFYFYFAVTRLITGSTLSHGHSTALNPVKCILCLFLFFILNLTL